MKYDMVQSDIFDIIIASIDESASTFIGHPHRIDFDATTCFVDLGINSIDYAEILTIAMEKLDVEMHLKDFSNTNNILDVVEIFIKEIYGS